MKNTSIICRLGRKRKMRDLIFNSAPKDFTTYIEPFVGSGDIYLFMGLDPSVKAVINDLDPIISDSWKVIKSNPDIGTGDKYDNLTKEQKTALAFKKTHSNKLDKLVANMLRLCGSFGGTIKPSDKKLYKIPVMKTRLEKIEGLANYMKNTTVLKQDYKTVIKKYDNVNAFLYLDPPYETKDDRKLYKEDNMNYEEMARVLSSVKGKFMMSINDSPNIRSTFKAFKQSKVRVKGGASEDKDIGKDRDELIIKNF